MTKHKSNTLITANGRSVSKRELKLIEQMVFDNLGKYMPDEKFAAIMTPPPSYAIQIREDGYPYLKHGYVRLKMIEIFGLATWDFEILPVYNGEPYRFVPADKEMKSPAGIMTFGKLTLRLNPLDSKGQPIWAEPTIKVITGSGWASRRKSMPFGKAVNASESSTFRRCAFPLGPALGLTLYWDDNAMLEEHNAPPKTLKEVWDKTGLGLIKAAELLDCEIAVVSTLWAADPAGVWEVLKGE